MMFSRLHVLLVLSALVCSAGAIPQFLQRVFHHDSAVHINNYAGHEYVTPPGDGTEEPPITAPFSQLIARCPDRAYWRCRYGGKLICACFFSLRASEHGADANAGEIEGDMFKDTNVTEADFLGHIVPGNAATLVPIFRIICPAPRLMYCTYVPGRWVDGIYLPGRFVCGCFPPLPVVELPPPASSQHLKKRNEAPPLLDERALAIKESVNNRTLSPDFPFESLQLGFCRGVDVAFKCCPLCVDGILQRVCRCMVVNFPCPKVKCC